MLELFYVFTILCFISSSSSTDPKIVGGENANTTDYVVSIRLANADSNFGRGHVCGGTLVKEYPNIVITAAHCMFDDISETRFRLRSATEFKIITGNVNKTINDKNTVTRYLKKLIIHEKYAHRKSFKDDIAILILNQAIHSYLHPNVKPVMLASSSFNPGTVCNIRGWGTLSWKGNLPDILQSANVSIISPQICNSTRSYNGSIEQGMICAGTTYGTPKDSCQGDSGGPLVCRNYLVGVTSNGRECALPDFPGIYTEVSAYRNWITNVMKKNSGNFPEISILLVFSSLVFSFKLNF